MQVIIANPLFSAVVVYAFAMSVIAMIVVLLLVRNAAHSFSVYYGKLLTELTYTTSIMQQLNKDIDSKKIKGDNT